MVSSMKTTVDISHPLLEAAKRLAAEQGVTLRELVEDGLRHVLERRAEAEPFRLRDASVGGNGLQPGVTEGDWTKIREMIYEGRGS